MTNQGSCPASSVEGEKTHAACNLPRPKREESSSLYCDGRPGEALDIVEQPVGGWNSRIRLLRPEPLQGAGHERHLAKYRFYRSLPQALQEPNTVPAELGWISLNRPTMAIAVNDGSAKASPSRPAPCWADLCHRMQRPFTRRSPVAHRRTVRTAVLRTQRPPTRWKPTPQPARTATVMLSDCGGDTSGMACADAPKDRARARTASLIIALLRFQVRSRLPLDFERWELHGYPQLP